MFSLLLVQAGKVGNGEPGAARVTSPEEADEAKRKEKLKRGRENLRPDRDSLRLGVQQEESRNFYGDSST
uniref:Uncharacterized protein n=1 Tax=Physcomitrium patens TaxID=3218 RepID=A0A7I4EA81_PHYPA